jgi:protein O-GlcNAc transferase
MENKVFTQAFENKWREYALSDNWNLIIDESEDFDRKENKKIALWRIKSLRALKRGMEANNELVESVQGEFALSIELAVELSEELIQCSMFQLANPIIEVLIEKKEPAGYFLKISYLREQAKYIEALKLIEKLIKYGGKWHELALVSEAWIRIRQGMLNQAEKCLAPFNNDNNLSTQKLLARFEIAAGKTENAFKRLLEISKRQPKDWEWPHLMAIVLHSKNVDPEKCISLIQEGLKRQPRQAESYALLSKIQLDINNKIDAKKSMVQALIIKPWLDAAVTPFIEYEISQRNFKDATKLIKEFQQIANTPRRKAMALDLMRYANEKNNKIISEAELLSINYPDEPVVLRTCAAALIICSKRDAATRLLEKVIELNRYDKLAYSNLAILYKDRGDIEDAIRVWSGLADEGDEISKVNLAQAFLINGDLVKSENLWIEIDEKNGDRKAIVERGFAEIYVKKGDYNKALLHITSACKLENNNPKNWVMKAQLSSLLYGELKGIELLEEIEEKFNEKIEIHKELFRLYQNQLTPKDIINKINKWKEDHPDKLEYIQMKSTIYNKVSDFLAAENSFKEGVLIDSEIGKKEYIRFLLQRGKFKEARKEAHNWIVEDQYDIRRLAQLTEVYFIEGNLIGALNVINKALELDPNRSSLVRQKIGILLNQEEYKKAESCAIELWNKNKEINSLSMWLRTVERQGEYDRAVTIVTEILKDKPNDKALKLKLSRQLRLAGNYNSCANLLIELHQQDPTNDLIAKNLISILLKLSRKNEALNTIRNVVKTQPNRFDVQINLANFALEQGLVDESRSLLKNLLKNAPEFIEIHLTLASVERKASNDIEEKKHWFYLRDNYPPNRWVHLALNHWVRLGLEKDLEKILNDWRKKETNNPTPWWIGFNLAKKLKRYKHAESNLKGVERRIGTNSEVLSARANLLSEDYKMSQAERLITAACLNSPVNTSFLEQKISINLKSGNWSEFDKDFERLCFLHSNNKYEAYGRLFFSLNCHPSWSEEKLYSFYKEWGDRVIKRMISNNSNFDRTNSLDDKIRIGYISPDFRMHAVAKFSLPIISHHQKNRFEIYAYAHLENNNRDTITDKFKKSFDHWRETQHWSLDELENNIKSDKIDILIDLAGHTTNTKVEIFNRRVAPIQASHIIGSGQTTGMPSTDYLIATDTIWPDTGVINSVEKVERLSFKGLVFEIPTDALQPCAIPSLKSGYIVFGVFARPIRINENVIRVWSDMLRRIPKSTIRFEHAPYLETDIQQHFIKIFAKYGISFNRLQFRHTRPYWKAFQEIDIQLDPFPAGSGTTATEGLYMGRLVITKQDRVGMGRIAHAQLEALELDNLCSAKTNEEYINKVCSLTEDLVELNKTSMSLRDRFLNSSLVDYSGYSKALEQAYLKWWNIYLNNRL